jgi:hypothetical protein
VVAVRLVASIAFPALAGWLSDLLWSRFAA